ncbi:hypothetical protein LCGC14_0223900 [marine sediment metagenome]|uniref:Uncharacterized protein n=1 Tax=marine sediment metagenome TaxID=412755 RepID=A0A0F9UTL4_9ZZZZ
MPEFDFGSLGKSKKQPKIIPIGLAIEKTKAYTDEIKRKLRERDREENERLEKMALMERKIEIDSNKVYMKLRSMYEKDFPIYDIIIRRAKSGRKHSYLESYINFINRYFKELVRDD